MAGYREHVSVSGMLGIAYGTGSVLALGFTPVQGMLAGLLTWIAGMLPDLDSESGKPIRGLFSIVAAIVPMFVMRYVDQLGGDTERALLAGLILYLVIRYGGASLVGRLSVHRGMFHSIPALIISAELTFLFYRHANHDVRWLMAGAVATGFLSHLVLDELYSVQWDGTKIKLKNSAGTALKMMGKHVPANAFTWGLLFFLSYAMLVKTNVILGPGEQRAPETLNIQEAKDLEEAPRYY
jgi:hypothetical protein